MAGWLQVGQIKSVAAQDANGDHPALCIGRTPVTQAGAKYYIFRYYVSGCSFVSCIIPLKEANLLH